MAVIKNLELNLLKILIILLNLKTFRCLMKSFNFNNVSFKINEGQYLGC